MFRLATASAIALAALFAVTTLANAQDARLTRIEPRPFYGATISIEAGVRVFRPLPRTRHMIISPGLRTPLNLTIKDVREERTVNSTLNHYDRSGGRTSPYAASGLPVSTYGGHYGRRGNLRRHRARRHFGHHRAKRGHRRGRSLH